MDIVSAIISSIIIEQLIYRCKDGSQRNGFIRSIATHLLAAAAAAAAVATIKTKTTTKTITTTTPHLLEGKEVRDEVAWRILPLGIWWDIGKRLESRLDILRFRSVCTLWRSSLPPPTRFPLKLPSPPSCDPKFQDVPYFIREVNLYSVLKSGLLVTFEEVDQGGKFHGLFTPRSKLVFDYPMISFMPPSGNVITKLFFEAKAYLIRMSLPRSESHPIRVEGQRHFQNNMFAKKMVLISSNADCVNPSYAKASDLSAVALLSYGEMKGRLALLRLAGSPENWVWETDFCSRVFQDIATYKGKLCTLDPTGTVYLMDYDSLQMIQIFGSWPIAHEREHKNLVEACGDLYLLDSFKTRTSGPAEGHKLNLRLQKWVKVEDLTEPAIALLPFLV